MLTTASPSDQPQEQKRQFVASSLLQKELHIAGYQQLPSIQARIKLLSLFHYSNASPNFGRRRKKCCTCRGETPREGVKWWASKRALLPPSRLCCKKDTLSESSQSCGLLCQLKLCVHFALCSRSLWQRLKRAGRGKLLLPPFSLWPSIP